MLKFYDLSKYIYYINIIVRMSDIKKSMESQRLFKYYIDKNILA